MTQTTFPVPTAAVVIACGVALAVAGLIGWHLGTNPVEYSRPSDPSQPAKPAEHAAPIAEPPPRHADETPVSELDRARDRLQMRYDEIQERMARIGSSMPPVREWSPDTAKESHAIEAEWHARDFLLRPLYIEPVLRQ